VVERQTRAQYSQYIDKRQERQDKPSPVERDPPAGNYKQIEADNGAKTYEGGRPPVHAEAFGDPHLLLCSFAEQRFSQTRFQFDSTELRNIIRTTET
jgi:hypothetical protein